MTDRQVKLNIQDKISEIVPELLKGKHIEIHMAKDNNIKIIKEYAKKDKRVKYIHFSRNFGKEAAMYAGLDLSSGDYIAIMDADLQDPPSLLPEMIKVLEDDNSDYDCIGTRRVTRKGEPPIRSFFARMFYKIIKKIFYHLFHPSIIHQYNFAFRK